MIITTTEIVITTATMPAASVTPRERGSPKGAGERRARAQLLVSSRRQMRSDREFQLTMGTCFGVRGGVGARRGGGGKLGEDPGERGKGRGGGREKGS